MDGSKRWQDFNSIIDTLDLDLKEKCLLLIVFRYVNYKTGYAEPSRTLIKNATKIKKDETLDKIFDSLIKKGFLIREVRKGKRSKYFIKVPPINVGTPISEGTPINVGTPPLKIGGTPPPKNGGQKEKEKKTKENKVIYIDLKFIDLSIDKVKLTQQQYDDLVAEFGQEVIHEKIIAMDNYVTQKKPYKDYNKAIRNWIRMDETRGGKKNVYTKGATKRDRGCFNAGAEEITIEMPRQQFTEYSNEQLEQLGID